MVAGFRIGQMTLANPHTLENQTNLGGGRKFGCFREYEGADLPASYSQSLAPWGVNQGWHVGYSCNVSSGQLAEWASGSRNALLQNFVTSIPAGVTLDIAIGHEPDVKINKAGSTYTWAQWNNAYDTIGAKWRAMRAAGVSQITSGNVRLACCFGGAYFNSGPGKGGVPGIAQPQFDAVDIITVDPYGMNGPESASNLMDDYLTLLASYGKPGAVWEYGHAEDTSLTLSNAIAYKVNQMATMASLCVNNNVEYLLYWEAGKNDDPNAGSRNMLTRPEYFTEVAREIDLYQSGTTIRPNAPVIAVPFDNQGYAAGTTPIVISGTAPKACTVDVQNNGGTSLGAATTDGLGGWFLNRVGQTNGAYIVKAVATDPSTALSSLPSDIVHYTVGTLPATPVITAPTQGQVLSSGTTSTAITGTSASGSATLTVTNALDVTIGTTTTDVSGNWSYTYSGLTPGSYAVKAFVTAAGVSSVPTQVRNFTVGIVIPPPPEGKPLRGVVTQSRW